MRPETCPIVVDSVRQLGARSKFGEPPGASVAGAILCSLIETVDDGGDAD